jgi:hypothetical protein
VAFGAAFCLGVPFDGGINKGGGLDDGFATLGVSTDAGAGTLELDADDVANRGPPLCNNLSKAC